jgi:hypothetical protein
MTPTPLLSSVKQGLAQARIKIDLVTAHSAEVFHTGVETLEAARSVVIGAGNDTVAVIARARQDLKQTLSDGASRLGHQLVRIATPTHEEQAALRKDEVKRKKRAKRAQAADDSSNPQPQP